MVVAFPGRVSAAERVERRHGLRGMARAVLRRGPHEIVAAARDRHRQRDGLRRGRDGEVAGRDLLALRFPRVEAAALGAPHGVPLNLDETDFDLHSGHGGAVEAGRHDRRLDRAAGVGEERQAPHSDVPGRGIDAERRAAGDPLPGHVRDLALERVVIGQRRVGARREDQPGLAGGIELFFLRLEVVEVRAPAPELPPVLGSQELPALLRELLGDGRRHVRERTARPPPADGLVRHRSAEEVARGDRSRELRAGDARASRGRRDFGVHAEVGTAERGDEKRAVRGALVAGDPCGDRIGPEGSLHGQLPRPFRRAPLGNGERALVHGRALAVVHLDLQLGFPGQELHSVRRVAAHDGLEADLLAELVDAAVREDDAAQERQGLLHPEVQVERPRVDPLVPVAAHECEVAVLLGGDEEPERPPVLEVPQPGRGRDRDPFRVRRPAPERGVVDRLDGDPRAGNGPPVVQARDEDERVVRAVLDGEAEVRHLDERRRRGAFSGEVASSNGLAAPDRGPDDALAGRQDEREIQSVRLELVGDGGEPAILATAAGDAGEVVLLEALIRREEIAGLHERRPGLRRLQVARVERELETS